MSKRDEDTRRFLSAVLESSPDAIIAADMEGRIMTWNAAAEQMLGYSAKQVIGLDLLTLMPAESRAAAAEMISRARRGEVIHGREVMRLRRDASVVIGLLNLAPIRNAEGRICGTLGILHDAEAADFWDVARDLARLPQLLPSDDVAQAKLSPFLDKRSAHADS